MVSFHWKFHCIESKEHLVDFAFTLWNFNKIHWISWNWSIFDWFWRKISQGVLMVKRLKTVVSADPISMTAHSPSLRKNSYNCIFWRRVIALRRSGERVFNYFCPHLFYEYCCSTDGPSPKSRIFLILILKFKSSKKLLVGRGKAAAWCHLLRCMSKSFRNYFTNYFIRS